MQGARTTKIHFCKVGLAWQSVTRRSGGLVSYHLITNLGGLRLVLLAFLALTVAEAGMGHVVVAVWLDIL